MRQTFTIEPFGHAIFAQRIDGSLLQNPRANPGADIVGAAALKNDGVDAVLLKDPAKE